MREKEPETESRKIHFETPSIRSRVCLPPSFCWDNVLFRQMYQVELDDRARILRRVCLCVVSSGPCCLCDHLGRYSTLTRRLTSACIRSAKPRKNLSAHHCSRSPCPQPNPQTPLYLPHHQRQAQTNREPCGVPRPGAADSCLTTDRAGLWALFSERPSCS